MSGDHSVRFFDRQFRRQVAEREFALNPFEQAALPYVRGRVLDLGCGLGNLSIETARRGAKVLAIDASPAAIERIRAAAEAENLDIDARLADLEAYAIAGEFDTVIAIGLLMFFARERALALLSQIQEHTAAGGVAIVNVLVEGTTYLEMFAPGRYTLLARGELEERFDGWDVLRVERHGFDAAGGTRKEFETIVARRSGGG